ncbi:MAG TPA: SpoIIE family protein phosphatase [Armatimonadota bacterium]|nr:SpoIIE family protein phosphatase [Armatimonadota bacterium]
MALLSTKMPRQALEELLPMRSFWWLVESAPDGIILVDSEGRIMLANAEAEKLFGYTEDELIDKPVEILIPERFREKHVKHRADYEAAPRTRPMGIGLELYGLRRDGTEFPAEISLSPVQTRAGLLAMAIIRDVTEYKREHFISETLQKALLSPAPEAVSGVKMASAYQSAYTGSLVGGDFFDVFALHPGSVGIVIGDVSGKGVEAAVYTALAKYSLRAYAYQDPVPSSALERLNSAVYCQSEPDYFTTLFYALLNVSEGTLSFANAGHVPPLYLTYPSLEVSELTLSGVPLGVLPETRYEQQTIEFKSGDRILFYTDGVTDARDGKGLYGPDNLKEFFQSRGLESPSDFIASLTETLQEWSGEHLRDDIAVLLISME